MKKKRKATEERRASSQRLVGKPQTLDPDLHEDHYETADLTIKVHFFHTNNKVKKTKH